jgi:ParB family chromosome partitioning protein
MAFQGDSIFWVEVEKIVPNPFQPRREFDEDKLKELAESVRMYGILQPLTVTRREIQNDDGSFRSEYELIAGERRLRASKIAGLSQVPVIIREGEQSEQEKLELAIIENLQREDLNAVDRAIAFRQLVDVFSLSHAQVAKKMGRSREYVSNSIRLLALPDYMLSALRTGDISEGHCRALLMLNDRPEEQDTVFRELLLKKLSVREVERIARHIATEKIRKKGEYDPNLIEMEKRFTETLGTRVSIMKTDFGGRLSIDYFTQEELEGILEGMLRETQKVSGHMLPIVAPPMALGELAEMELGNPRADELAILTERTGLELVPEPNQVPIIPLPMVEEEVTAEPVVPSPEPQVAESIENFHREMTVAPEPVPEVTQTHYGEETVADVSTPAPQPVIAVAPAPPTNSLRDQLTLLLQKSAQAPVTQQVVNNITSQPNSHLVNSVESAVTTETIASATPPVEKKPILPVVPDDSDLYSIRDFSI